MPAERVPGKPVSAVPVEPVPGKHMPAEQVEHSPSEPSPKQTGASDEAAAQTTEDRYGLDSLSRKAPLRGRIYCPQVEMVRYRGEVVPFQKKLDVYVGFIEHLRQFETIVRDTAIEFYGRAPAKIWHYGPNRCRRIRQWPFLISEHSLGNAIDVGGFVFERDTNPESSLPKRLRASFTINISLHWTARRKRDEIHSRFLRALAERILASDALFRTVLGPADRNHKGHFHFDMAPRENVVVF